MCNKFVIMLISSSDYVNI